jgi:hypothetical protein
MDAKLYVIVDVQGGVYFSGTYEECCAHVWGGGIVRPYSLGLAQREQDDEEACTRALDELDL